MYPKELVSSPKQKIPHLTSDSHLIRILKSEPERDLYTGEYTPLICDQLVEPNGVKEVYRLSLVLHGTYKKEYSNIIVEDDAYFDNWDGRECVDNSLIKYRTETRFPIFLDYGIISQNDNVSITDNTNGTKRFYYLKINHAPTRCNFWHFEVSILDENNKIVKYKSKSKSRKEIASKILSDIIYFAIEDSNRFD